jgi:tRNA U34 2-thiouridine synthase MnmA/TrmU
MQRGKGIVLYSGGLDSLLAAKILIDQGIEIIGFHCVLPFFPPDIKKDELKPVAYAEQIHLKLHYYFCDDEYIKMVKNPPHGYGKHINPCIDCKIFFIRKAAEFMKESGADFIATGEVVGQRPMSQMKHMINHIEHESGIEGRLVRPLSAKILKPTIPEMQGIVDREKLFGFNGRGRKPQMELAQQFGIQKFAAPAGGCHFTDEFISRRVRDLFTHHKHYSPVDFFLLTIGRHFRISHDLKIIIARNDEENILLEKYATYADYIFIPDFKGPMAFVKGIITDESIKLISSMQLKYGKRDTGDNVTIIQNGVEFQTIKITDIISQEKLEFMRI